MTAPFRECFIKTRVVLDRLKCSGWRPIILTLDQIQKQASEEIKNAQDAKTLETLRVKYLGRNSGFLTAILRSLKNLPDVEKRKLGPRANRLRETLEQLFDERLTKLKKHVDRAHAFDITAPGKKFQLGHLHPLTKVGREVKDIFVSMGFEIVEGPEVETEYYNFDALNIPENHPARDMWDTFWLQNNNKQLTNDGNKNKKGVGLGVRGQRLLMRTHTSPVQIRYMETHQPPFQIIVPGRVFRYEATDAGHEINFYQVEGLMVGKDISLANFKYVIETLFKRLFTKNISVRLRPSYFPFVEPGLEVDISCVRCKGKGCSTCKHSGWLEIMGAGMVHPHVFEYAHYNPNDLQGFAFGMGLDRIAMLKYNIPDIRLFYSGDMRFIKQF